MAVRARLETELNEKLECLRSKLDAGVQDKRRELESRNAAELDQLRTEWDSKHNQVQSQRFYLYFNFLSVARWLSG